MTQGSKQGYPVGAGDAGAAQATARPAVSNPWLRKLSLGQYGIVWGLLAMSVALTILSPYFLSQRNLLNVARQSSVNAVIAAGMTIIIVSGGIDLSVGSVLAFASCVMAPYLKGGSPLVVVLMIGLGAGAAAGLMNGVLITRGNLPPFIATLGMMSIARGAALVLLFGQPVAGFRPEFRWIGEGYIGPIPFPVVIAVGVYVALHLMMTQSRFGRYTYAIGGNEEAARLSGVNIALQKNAIYALSGLCAGLAGIMLTARLGSAEPISGVGYELDAIAAAVIGGTSLSGGRGNLIGTVIGALIMGVLRNGLNLLNVNPFWQQILIGAVILGAVLADEARKRR
jgi:ribose transport system permease protein